MHAFSVPIRPGLEYIHIYIDEINKAIRRVQSVWASCSPRSEAAGFRNAREAAQKLGSKEGRYPEEYRALQAAGQDSSVGPKCGSQEGDKDVSDR